MSNEPRLYLLCTLLTALKTKLRTYPGGCSITNYQALRAPSQEWLTFQCDIHEHRINRKFQFKSAVVSHFETRQSLKHFGKNEPAFSIRIKPY